MPAEPRQRLRFGRDRRLRSAGEFARLKVDGQRLAQGCLVLNWQPVAAGSSSRLGVITSRKVGNAVVRARARRLLREVFRQNQFRITPPSELVLVARPSIAPQAFAGVERDFLQALRRARLLSVEAVAPKPI
jgi:ribonuclease P protein component